MDNPKTKITEAYLEHCSPEKAYEWLWFWHNSPELRKNKLEEIFAGLGELYGDRDIVEKLLLKRNNPLIDLGLAQYGCTHEVLKAIFVRGSSGHRCAVLSNKYLFTNFKENPAIDIKEVVKKADEVELVTLARNPQLSDEFYLNLINRTHYFAELSEEHYKTMLQILGYNPRLKTPYNLSPNYIHDGYADYRYCTVFNAAWKLTSTSPRSQEWAEVLLTLLNNAMLPFGFEEVNQVIETWRIDPPKEVEPSSNIDSAFFLRSRLADLLPADRQLLKSNDLALRQSFYRRFTPEEFESWQVFYHNDGAEFVKPAIFNPNLWKSMIAREILWNFTTDCPDPLENWIEDDYFSQEKYIREKHPEWFNEEDETNDIDNNAGLHKIEGLLKSINDNLKVINSELNPKRKK